MTAKHHKYSIHGRSYEGQKTPLLVKNGKAQTRNKQEQDSKGMHVAREKYVLTPEGLADLKSELERLRNVRLPKVAEKLNEARSNEAGDMGDNIEYEEILKERAFITGRILTLENILSRAEVMSHEFYGKGVIGVDSRVTVRYENGTVEMHHIVGSAEVNRGQGQISNESPVGKALISKKMGDEVEVIVPSGTLRFNIIAVA